VTTQSIIETYGPGYAKAIKQFQDDAVEMASRGYCPTALVWIPAEWSMADFLGALFLCLIIIGAFVLLYMLITPPNGSLCVVYERDGTP
jgi:hypothetical protein